MEEEKTWFHNKNYHRIYKQPASQSIPLIIVHKYLLRLIILTSYTVILNSWIFKINEIEKNIKIYIENNFF